MLSAQQFREELVNFDRALIDAMGQRVKAISNHWTRPEIHIDIDLLQSDHAGRAKCLADALASSAPSQLPPWDECISALVELERRFPR